MLIKITGGCLLFLGCVFWGLFMSGCLGARKKSLAEIRTALSILETEIVFSSHHLKDVFGKVANISGCGMFFTTVRENMEEMGIERAWIYAVDKNKGEMGLKKEDAEILKTLSTRLGMSDREQQVKNIKYTDALILKALTEAEEEYRKSAKFYRSIGVVGGLFLIILLA